MTAEKLEHLYSESKRFVIDNELPQTDVALYGVRCPYCGKSDRIRELDHPDQLPQRIDSSRIQPYVLLWQTATESNAVLAICKFCQNLVRLSQDGTAGPLVE